ncbi:secA DEAD-like domain-containing protein [Ditylenchus destructor]|nr:secA DEAD-like domain-containing protein [Ditylenchus destructor]
MSGAQTSGALLSCTPERCYMQIAPRSKVSLSRNSSQVVIDPGASKERTFQELLNELEETNSFTYIKEIIPGLIQNYQKITSARENDSTSFQAGRKISEWSAKHIKGWAISVRGKKDVQSKENYLSEAIAVVSQANQLATGNVPRAAQILTLLVLLNRQKGKGRLVQVSTGEGKSTICAMLAVILALKGETVDIISSSPLLASRDADERRDFFSMFVLTVSHNTSYENPEKNNGRSITLFGHEFFGNSEERRKRKGFRECYNADILYGTLGNFEGDLLRHEFMARNTRGKRECQNAIIDEGDSMLVDDIRKIVMLSGHIPGTEFLEGLLISTWTELKRLRKEYGENYTQSKYRASLQTHLNDLVNGSRKKIPAHLYDYAKSQVTNWAYSAVKAETLIENKDYIVKLNDEKRKIIAIVDFENTGIVQRNMVWRDGLHQFLQIKHSLRITPENFTSCFMSNFAYFKRYTRKNDKGEADETGLFGMTGTIGSEESQKFIQDLYPVDLAFIPTYKKKRFSELEGIIAPDEKEWYKKIKERVLEEAKSGRAVLVITLAIKEVDKLNTMLKEVYDAKKIRKYSRNDNKEHEAVHDQVDSGDVILATNLAGRGTDIKTSRNVEAKGGLFVIVTFLPNNLRIELQAFGRTSRQGNLGSAQLILNLASLKMSFTGIFEEVQDALAEVGLELQFPSMDEMTVAEFKKLRDHKEQFHLDTFKTDFLPGQTFKDEMFAEFSKLIKSMRDESEALLEKRRKENKDKKKKIPDYDPSWPKFEQMQELWGLKLKTYEDKLKTVSGETETKHVFQEIRQDFDSFMRDIRLLNKFHFKNPGRLILQAFDEYEEKEWEGALSTLAMTANLDKNFAFPAYYLAALVQIMLSKEEKITQTAAVRRYDSSKINLGNAKVAVKQQIISLESAKDNLRSSDTAPESDIMKQFDAKIELMTYVKENIDKALNVLNECAKESDKQTFIYHEARDLMSWGLVVLFEITKYPK